MLRVTSDVLLTKLFRKLEPNVEANEEVSTGVDWYSTAVMVLLPLASRVEEIFHLFPVFEHIFFQPVLPSGPVKSLKK